MIGVIRSEWVKLRRPAYLWVPFGLTIAFTLLFTILPILNAVAVPDGKSGERHEALISDFTGVHGAVKSVTGIYGLIAMIALVIFAAAVATEYTNGTIRNLLIREPRRVRLMLLRWLALVSWTALLVLVFIAVGIVAGLVTMKTQGYSTSQWFESDGLTHIGATVLYLWLALSLFATFGAILALVLKTPVAAIGIGIAWFLIVENLLGALVSGTNDWLPGNIITSVAHGGTDAHGFWDALALIAGYVAVLGGAALALFSRNDVSS
jgi:hypothetical protein